ncbi:site-specific integrase [Rhodococcus maanshanensis]|uniref:site-specific integrase n=1 Tax=Rhodococcus maanshanensis TaxID=183556 RepID=UPI0022B3347D|nr:site-specific integrase [Rhodococcus maanshanensis]MCZ4557921.1 site-specific integrase [Rhodococcus maanshanensis]
MSTDDIRADSKPYKDKTTGLWCAVITLPPGGDGKRKRVVLRAKSLKDAAAKRRERMKELEKGLNPTSSKATVESWLDYWLDNIARRRVRPRTFAEYQSTIRRNIVPFIGAHRLDKLQPAHVREMHKMILAAGKSSRTAEKSHNILSKSLSDAIRDGHVARNVCEHVDKPKVTPTSRGALTADQARILLRHAAKHADPMASRWAAALMLGGRQGELIGLQWDRVDLERGLVDFEWQLQRIPYRHGCGEADAGKFPCGKAANRPATCPRREFNVEPWFKYQQLHHSLCLTEPKTSKSIRVVPLPDPLVAILREYRKSWQPNPHNLVWTSEAGLPIGPREDYEAWDDALSSAELPDVPLHAARHTTATLLLEAGVDIHIISQILGHSAILTTQGYAHVDQTLARQALGTTFNDFLSVEQ